MGAITQALAKSLQASGGNYMFRDGHLSAMIVQYPSDQYKAMKAGVEAQLSQGSNRDPPRSTLTGLFGGPGANIVFWKAKGGVVMTSKDENNRDGNLILAWMSNEEIARYSGK